MNAEAARAAGDPPGGVTRRRLVRGGLAMAAAAALAGGVIEYDMHRRRPPRLLRRGDRGAAVREVQIQVAGWVRDPGDLEGKRFLPITGVYDAATEQAVRRFQRGYALGVDHGMIDAATRSTLASLVRPNGSTIHFPWDELFRGYSDNVITPAIHENTRRLMFKLQALRRKLGDIPVSIKAGFREHAANDHESSIGDDRFHAIGAAVDFTAFGVPRDRWYKMALSCGFTGLGPVDRHWQHCDSRMELGAEEPWYASSSG